MSPRSHFLALVFGVALLTSTGCGDDPEASDSDSSAVTAHDGGDHDGHHVDEEEDVPCTAAYPTYKDGMTAPSGDLTVRLLSVSPAPPRQQTPNKWLLEVVDASGAPVSGANIENPNSYMKVHMHAGRTLPKVLVQSEPGRIELSAIDFKMRGPWEVNFDVVVGGKSTPTTFQICVQ